MNSKVTLTRRKGEKSLYQLFEPVCVGPTISTISPSIKPPPSVSDAPPEIPIEETMEVTLS